MNLLNVFSPTLMYVRFYQIHEMTLGPQGNVLPNSSGLLFLWLGDKGRGGDPNIIYQVSRTGHLILAPHNHSIIAFQPLINVHIFQKKKNNINPWRCFNIKCKIC